MLQPAKTTFLPLHEKNVPIPIQEWWDLANQEIPWEDKHTDAIEDWGT